MCVLGRACRAQFCPAAPLWLHCASHNRAISLGQHKHDYQAGADLFIPANNAGHICDQVRPLSATCGTREIASSGSPNCRAGARSVQKPGTQRKSGPPPPREPPASAAALHLLRAFRLDGEDLRAAVRRAHGALRSLRQLELRLLRSRRDDREHIM